MTLKDRIGIDIQRKLKLEEAIDWAAARGVRYIDVNLDADPELLSPAGAARAAKIREQLASAGVHLGLHTLSAVNIAETSPFVAEAVDRYLNAYMEACRAMGAGWIVVHAGYHFTADYSRRREAALQRLERAADRAERIGVRLLLENMNREPDDAEVHYLGFSLEECRYFFGRLTSPALRWSFTVNHAHMVPEGIDGFIDAMDLGRCGEVRLADNRGDREEHLKPGEGSIDFARLFRRIEGAGYRGHYMNAFGSLEDMLAGRDYLARIAEGG